MIGLCTDSNSQLPPILAARHGIEVVPLTIHLDGVAYLEGVDLDADDFYSGFGGEHLPTVGTAAPTAAAFTAAYQRLACAGANEIVSVHVGSEVSATFDAARLGATTSPVPVHLVDTHSASFAVALSVLAAAEAIAAGGGASASVAAARRVASSCGNVFVVGTLELPCGGNRSGSDLPDSDGIPVLRLREGTITQISTARTAEDAARAMAEEISATAGPLRVGIGVADASSVAVADELHRLLRTGRSDIELLAYRVGPSVGVHTGPGTAGAVYHRC